MCSKPAFWQQVLTTYQTTFCDKPLPHTFPFLATLRKILPCVTLAAHMLSVAAKAAADRSAPAEWMFARTGAHPFRFNTVYQLLADAAAGVDANAPWLNLPEYVLSSLGGRAVAEYTNATHTGMVDLDTADWSDCVLRALNLPRDPIPPIVPVGTVVGKLAGPLAELPAFHDTELIAPACHDTASAIAGIPVPLEGAAYICSGTWSLVGTLVSKPITDTKALAAGFTNLGATNGGFCFHANVNGMWLLKQCLEQWRRKGRDWEIAELVALAAGCDDYPGVVSVDAPSLLLDGDMPALLNEQLSAEGCHTLEDRAGNEPLFARVIFESLASRYASALAQLETIAGLHVQRIHILGGGSRNWLLTRLTAERTGRPVDTGNVESSTVGNFAVQLAVSEANGEALCPESVRRWAQRLSTTAHPSRRSEASSSVAG